MANLCSTIGIAARPSRICRISKRASLRLQDELVMNEKDLRDTQIRSIHEMGDLKRAQELRVDEYSLYKTLRESHDTIQRLTSQMHELQETVNYMHDLREFSRYRIDLEWKLSHVPSQPAVIFKSSIYAKPRPTLATWYMEFVWTTGKRFWQATSYVRFITETLSRNSSLYDSKCW